MGPTNVALVKLFEADQQLRAAEARLEAVTRGVRYQERKVRELTEKLQAATTALREAQSQAGQLDLDLKSRDAHIEKLRTQQQQAKNHKEYQTFLVEINTEKVDRAKVEDQTLKVMEQVETRQKEAQDLNTQLEAETSRLAEMRQHIDAQRAAVQSEVDQLRPVRDEVAEAVSAQARDTFQRLAERYDGEALAAIGQPNRKREEYVCTACNMELVADMYNRLRMRDEMVFCPSCRRLLYIPADLPPERAIVARKEKREPRRNIPAASNRQESAADVSRSISAAQEEQETTAPAPQPQDPPQA